MKIRLNMGFFSRMLYWDDPEKIANVLIELKLKGETAEEIIGATKAILATKDVQNEGMCNYQTLDVCGTGGDDANTFNISTATAILVASCEVFVAKNGGSAISSKVGSSDVVSALGIPLCRNNADINRSLFKHHLAFISSADFYRVPEPVKIARKLIKGPSILNLVGPLLNPAYPKFRLLGVCSEKHQLEMEKASEWIGTTKSLIVRGCYNEDEITLTGEIHSNSPEPFSISDFGLPENNLEDLTGGETAEENANIITRIFDRSEKGPKLNVVLANAAAAFYVSGVVRSIREGMIIASSAVTSGAPLRLIHSMRGS